MIFKNCAPFTNCVTNIKNIQINNADYIDLGMPMCDLIEYSDNYSKKKKWRVCCNFTKMIQMII